MGSKKIESYEQKFLERGLTPLEEIKNDRQKVECIDFEGYKFKLSYHGGVQDKRTKNFDKWDKNNPFKPDNMRLYASKTQKDAEILSDDEELFNASIGKIRFVCPKCGKEFSKKWCHWIAMPKDKHFCPECSYVEGHQKHSMTYQQLVDIFNKEGYVLLSSYEEYKGSHTRLSCKDSDGYKYATTFNNIRTKSFKSYNKFSFANPFCVENLQKYCNDNSINLKIISCIENKNNWFKVQCSCGEIFEATPTAIKTGKQRCKKCVALDSKYSLMTKQWLQEHNIPFVQEYRFDDCRYKKPLPFDYKIDWQNRIILIEVDGGQHFYTTQWTNEEILKEQKLRDKIKDDYCQMCGYELLRIPYWLYNTDTYKQKLNETFFA